MKEENKPIRSQKTKPYIIMQLIKKQADYDHLLSTAEIIYILNEYGISAEQKSVQRDIKTINEMLMLEDYVLNGEEFDIESVKEDVKDYKDIRSIQYRSAAVDHRGYYFQREEGYFEEIRLLLECINASKFISKSSAKYLKQMILKDVNIYDIEKLEHITPITNRTKTNNKQVFDNVKALSDAIKAKCKVQFNYKFLYLPDGASKPKGRYGRKDAPYIVSPYELLINDGCYYLLCFDDQHQEKWTYRVDRMENICLLQDEKREGAESFVDFNAEDYAKTNFSMFAGKNQFIEIKFDNRCLNAVFEKLGTDKVTYKKFDSKYFTITMITGINEQFYGWLCTFGNKAKVIGDTDQVKAFREYVKKIADQY
jgi:predicted DNA-binding transcriptional regulator YafY